MNCKEMRKVYFKQQVQGYQAAQWPLLILMDLMPNEGGSVLGTIFQCECNTSPPSPCFVGQGWHLGSSWLLSYKYPPDFRRVYFALLSILWSIIGH